jgi:hypothetical protein
MTHTSCQHIITFAADISESFEHKLNLIHPGDPNSKSKIYLLRQHGDGLKQSCKYSMWMDSAVCRDEKCFIVKVQLNWDALGRYSFFELKKGFELTKLDHKPFTPQDLNKLQEILLDKTSALAEVKNTSLVATKQPSSENKKVDGVSGATVLSLRNDVIIGAAYTCYDLWHMANGDIVEHIKEISQKTLSNEVVLTFLKSDDAEKNIFALECLSKRKIKNASISKKILINIEKGKVLTVEPTMSYYAIMSTDKKDLKESMLNLFKKLNSRQRLIYLKNILTGSIELDSEFYNALCEELPTLESYFETQIFFQICSNVKVAEKVLVPQVLKLLSHKKFFIQRRAYQYLILKKRDKEAEKIIERFYQKYKSRL